jgi:hypothetical protein
MSVYKHSRLIRSKMFIDEDDDELFISTPPIFIESKENDIHYVWMEGDRLDLIATEAYGNPQLKHLILMANPQYRTEFEIKAGEHIIIPSGERSDLAWAF